MSDISLQVSTGLPDEQMHLREDYILSHNENDRLGMSHRLGHGGIISLIAMTYNGLRDQINYKFIWLHDG